MLRPSPLQEPIPRRVSSVRQVDWAYAPTMKIRFVPLAAAALSLAAGVAMTRALIGHEGVGAMEYVTGAAIVLLAAVTTLRLSRRAIQRA